MKCIDDFCIPDKNEHLDTAGECQMIRSKSYKKFSSDNGIGYKIPAFQLHYFLFEPKRGIFLHNKKHLQKLFDWKNLKELAQNPVVNRQAQEVLEPQGYCEYKQGYHDFTWMARAYNENTSRFHELKNKCFTPTVVNRETGEEVKLMLDSIVLVDEFMDAKPTFTTFRDICLFFRPPGSLVKIL
jgi:hypothetical protein